MRSLLFLLLSFSVAGSAAAQVGFGPEVGANMCNYMFRSYGDTKVSNIRGGVRAGAKADIGLCSHFLLQLGLFYMQNGITPPRMSGGSYTSMNINTMVIPVNIVYKMKTGKAVTPFFALGPYVGINISGSATRDMTVILPAPGSNPTEAATNRHLNIGNAYGDDLRRYDAGINGNMGLQLANGLYTNVMFQRGLLNMQPHGNAQNSINYFSTGISLGYFFHCHHAAKTTVEKK